MGSIIRTCLRGKEEACLQLLAWKKMTKQEFSFPEPLSYNCRRWDQEERHVARSCGEDHLPMRALYPKSRSTSTCETSGDVRICGSVLSFKYSHLPESTHLTSWAMLLKQQCKNPQQSEAVQLTGRGKVRKQPTRLLCPWDSPGGNTGVGCHALLQGIFPTQGANPRLLGLLLLAGRLLTTSATQKPQYLYTG